MERLSRFCLLLLSSILILYSCAPTSSEQQSRISKLQNSPDYYTNLKDVITDANLESLIVEQKIRRKLDTKDKIISLNVLPAKSFCDVFVARLPAKRIKFTITCFVASELFSHHEWGWVFMPRLILVDSTYSIISSKLDYTRLNKDLSGFQLVGQIIVTLNKEGQYYLLVCSDNIELLESIPYRFDIRRAATGSYEVGFSLY
jgi:hypothetical protein